MLENPQRRTRVKIVGDDKINKYIRKRRLQSWHTLETEDGDLPYHEVVQEKRSIEDSFPMHVGNAVLQHSKLHFLRYVTVLSIHLCGSSWSNSSDSRTVTFSLCNSPGGKQAGSHYCGSLGRTSV